MTETAEQQRKRILIRSPETSPEQYDAAVKLGYAPESWDGMYKLPTGHPITWLTKNWALVREIRCRPGSSQALFTRSGRRRTRLVLRRAKS